MTTKVKLTIKPLDPLISRDSRPFGRGQGMRACSLDWLTPSVVCGALRSFAGKIHGSFDSGKLQNIKIRGPFLECEGRLFFPRPRDFLKSDTAEYALRPQACRESDGGADMPLDLLPAVMRPEPEEDFKPNFLPAFWSCELMARWLAEDRLTEDDRNFELPPSDCLKGPGKDERVHVGINPETGTSEDSLLFSTVGLDFKVKRGIHKEILQTRVALEAEADGEYAEIIRNLPPLHTLGGERRLAEWRAAEEPVGWTAPRMPDASRLRMVLATPALFSRGWLPGWIDRETREGTIPGTSVGVRLVSAVVGRWMPISGWTYGREYYGPKPLRRMAPAGSVYFFERLGDAPVDWETLWLRSVCDREQDRKDGFGAALWGVW
ncbi:MAG: type III-B CRISPR module-associated protein Cmr3 [Synergistaceae bacterium]|jgi:CRISPR-associated protein Cmr3|nr:type III-B CRISPR module-associated protein Cmr3 [Synergistaceae bacterium]